MHFVERVNEAYTLRISIRCTSHAPTYANDQEFYVLAVLLAPQYMRSYKGFVDSF